MVFKFNQRLPIEKYLLTSGFKQQSTLARLFITFVQGYVEILYGKNGKFLTQWERITVL